MIIEGRMGWVSRARAARMYARGCRKLIAEGCSRDAKRFHLRTARRYEAYAIKLENMFGSGKKVLK